MKHLDNIETMNKNLDELFGIYYEISLIFFCHEILIKTWILTAS